MREAKYDLSPLIRANFINPDWSARQQLTSLAGQVAVPLLVGGVAGVLVARGLPISNGISVVLPATSLLVGAMFGAFIFLTNLRVKLAESATYAFRSDLQRLVGITASACLWVALVAIALAALLALTGSLPFLRAHPVRPITVGVLGVVATHLGLSLLATVRRLIVVYIAMFAADFNPTVGPTRVRATTTRRRSRSLR